MIFKDISNFNNLNDYLPILNGCINAELTIMNLVLNGAFKSLYLKKWYKKYKLSAVLADILILFIGLIITRFLYKYIFSSFNIWKFTFLAVLIQIIHDLLFYLLFKNSPLGYNKMLDFFKKYSKEVGIKSIFGDSFMIVLTCLFASHFASYNLNTNIITLIISLYFIPYVLNSK
jgi:uncharacterized protein YacL